MQASKDTPPTVVEYFPAEQLVQTDTPVVEAYLPAAQSAHIVPASEYLPARQFTQSADESDADGADFPAAQFRHVSAVLAASIVEYFPAAQSAHIVPASEYLPARQFTQSADASDADGADFPAAQFRHVSAPLAASIVEYFPAAQSTHVEPSSEYFPARQFTQSANASDADGDDFPALQSRQLLSEVPDAYFPAAQSVQTNIISPSANLPAGHASQSDPELDPDSDDLPAGQLPHDSGLVAAVVVEYFPTSQFKHVPVVVAADCVEYFPAAQAVHEPLPGFALYFPATQSTHVEPASEYWPARQFTQSANASDADGADFPAAQFRHLSSVVAARFVEYFPAAQSTHVEPASEYFPARQFTQSANASDADGADFPAAQFMHVAG